MDTVIRVREAMTNRVITMGPDQTIDKAAQLMLEKGIGCIIIMENNKPIGIVTERNICYGVVAPNKLPSKIKLEQIMSSPIRTISPDKPLIEAAKFMVKNNFRRLPVIEKNRLIGIITARDVVAVSPKTIEVLREVVAVYGENDAPSGREVIEEGMCEACGDYGVSLYQVNGNYICEDCKEDALGEE
jgi:CBS domain-containing protein